MTSRKAPYGLLQPLSKIEKSTSRNFHCFHWYRSNTLGIWGWFTIALLCHEIHLRNQGIHASQRPSVTAARASSSVLAAWTLN